MTMAPSQSVNLAEESCMNDPENRIHQVFIYLRVHSAAAAIDFYRQAFGAQEVFRLTEPSGRIGHAELRIGPAVVMLSDEYPESQLQGPRTLGGTTFSIHLHVDNADQLMEQAVAAGATVLRPLGDHFYGERSGTVRDPFGHEWMLGHEIEAVAPEEMQRRYTELFK
jgi:PhnB protein